MPRSDPAHDVAPCACVRAQEPIDIRKGLLPEQADRMAALLGFRNERARLASRQMSALYQFLLKADATQVEINPFGESRDGRVVCFDAKITFDDNAEFRQPEIFAMRDTQEENPREVQAAKLGLNYIGMQGNIGCLGMLALPRGQGRARARRRAARLIAHAPGSGRLGAVNGAGLAMATMDIIKLNGGEPANFLDVGGNVKERQVTEAFRIITSDPQVKAILVNVFGGIVDCAMIATGIVSACRSIKLSLPLVVRLAGSNAERARDILSASGVAIITARDLGDAAAKAVATLRH